MATLSTAHTTLQEYLNTSYKPDCEFIDGELKEKPLVGLPHGRIQVLLASWFHKHEQQWNILSAVETRIQINANRVRLPDFVLVSASERSKGALTAPPLVAIEVLSPNDRYADLRQRAQDLHSMGVENIWLLDPEAQTAEVWRDEHWQPVKGSRLEAAASPIYLDLEWLWAAVAE